MQLHQQKLTPNMKAFVKTLVVLPPDSEIVTPVSVRSASNIQPGSCSLVEPSGGLMEDYGVVVGRTLVDASSWSASVLMVNPNAEEIVLPSFAFVGDLVPVCQLFRWLLRTRLCRVIRARSCRTIWRTLSWDLTLLWGRLVDCCFRSFSIGMNMCSQRPGNLLPVILHQFSMRS